MKYSLIAQITILKLILRKLPRGPFVHRDKMGGRPLCRGKNSMKQVEIE